MAKDYADKLQTLDFSAARKGMFLSFSLHYNKAPKCPVTPIPVNFAACGNEFISTRIC